MPSLVLLPGLLCDGRLWRDQAAALSGIAQAVVPDLGRDDTVDGMARRVLDAVPGRFALAGLSMGGYVAMALMRLAPERVSRLCLMSTSARPDPPAVARRRRALATLVRNQPAERFRGVTPRLLPEMLHPDRLGEPGLEDTITAMAARVGRDAYLRQQAAIIARPDSRPMLPGLRLPALVAVGDADRVTPPELAQEIASLIPGSTLLVMEGCGHLPPLERPDIVSGMLRRWLTADQGPL